ncbi:MAG: hypothetical protein F6J97_10340 [Leptolyngbya sp. SIO4C1]|nr:hypothetical protein [Leptolyngbya sp. SIO4C1]
MANLKLISLECKKTEDWSGADEPYLRVNGNNVWGPISLNNGQSATVDRTVEFSQTAEIALYDQDVGSWFDTDDHLGTLAANTDQVGQGEQRGRFNKDGADYTLTWEVLA